MKQRKFTLGLLVFILVGVQNMFALNPSRTYKQLPDKYNMVYEEIEIVTVDNVKLKGWYFPNKTKTTKTILLCHNGNGNMGDYLRRVDQFVSIGYNTVIFDYRGFGESDDFEIDNNMYLYPHFQDDVKAAIDYIRKQYVAKFDVYGWGMGAGLALGIGWNRNEIRKIIADTPFLSMEDLENRFQKWDDPMEVPFAGYDKKYEPIYSFDSDPVVSTGDSKGVKLIVGSNDLLYTPGDMKSLAAKQKKYVDKDVYVVPNPDAQDNFRVDKAEYFKAIRAFLEN